MSVVSPWEIAIKMSIGKLRLAMALDEFVAAQAELLNLGLVDVTLRHAIALQELPLHHRDPFDRMLIAQAIAEGVPIVTNDAMIRRYPVEVVW